MVLTNVMSEVDCETIFELRPFECHNAIINTRSTEYCTWTNDWEIVNLPLLSN